MIYRFADYALDLETYALSRGAEPIAVEPQVFSVLAFLIEHRDRVVTRDDLIAGVWKGRIVSDAAMSSRISAARQAIGDSGEKQEAIRTIPRRGFRFVLPVSVEGPAATGAIPPSQPGPQTIRYCTAPDGVQIAYASAGHGPPLLKVANWLNHLEFDWGSPIWCGLFDALTRDRQLVRYDSRGVGLSDWEVADLSFPALASDLETVVEAAGLSRFALLGISQGAGIAIDYAARHPERVTHLVLWGGFARGRRTRGSAEDIAQSEAFKTLMRQGWGKEASVFRRMFASLYLPDATDEQIRFWTDMQRVSTSPENAVRLRDAIDGIDVTDRLAQVTTPTLILHSAREEVAPIAEARFMASRIANARFVLLDSANHLVMDHEPAWARAVAAIGEFLQSA